MNCFLYFKILDTNQLSIETVFYNDEVVPFAILPSVKPFGEPLEITIPSSKK